MKKFSVHMFQQAYIQLSIRMGYYYKKNNKINSYENNI